MSLRQNLCKLLLVDLCVLSLIYVHLIAKSDLGLRYGNIGTLCVTILGPAFVLFEYHVDLRYWLWWQNLLFFLVGYLLVFVTHKRFLHNQTIRKGKILIIHVICSWLIYSITVLYADYYGFYFSSYR